VVEHLHDPPDALAAIGRVLKPGGRLWIATPNLRALGLRRFGATWLALDPPRHLVLFHRESLGRALEDAGFADAVAVRPPSDAALTFPQSVGDGHGPRGAHLRALAAAASVAILLDPDRAEELVMTARAPG
jgi:SAM-dependent methyltransferase